MPKFTDIASVLILGLLLTPPALAQDSAWVVAPPANGSGFMTRTLENVTLTYKRVPDDDDTLRITVNGCGDTPWSMQDSLNGVTAESLRDSAKEEFDNARLNCKLPDGLEDRFMAGFGEAFAKVKPFLPPHVQTVGGWKLEDKGGMPGDDSERSVTMTKVLPVVTMRYQASGTSDGASFSLECKGASYGGGFDFGNPPEDHVKVVNQEMAEDYADFAKDCKGKPETQAELMQDFPEALATLEGWLKAKPFVYPPDNSSKQ